MARFAQIIAGGARNFGSSEAAVPGERYAVKCLQVITVGNADDSEGGETTPILSTPSEGAVWVDRDRARKIPTSGRPDRVGERLTILAIAGVAIITLGVGVTAV